MMKKLILSAVATSLLAGTAMAAPQHRPAPPAKHVTVVKKKTVVRAPQYRTSWRKGERFDSRQARNYQVVDYHRYRTLKAPPRGYRYVRSGNDAVLVGITSGIIAAVFANAIR